jgi:hypothetical protein
MFADFTNALGQQAAAEKAFAYGGGPKRHIRPGCSCARGAVANS